VFHSCNFALAFSSPALSTHSNYHYITADKACTNDFGGYNIIIIIIIIIITVVIIISSSNCWSARTACLCVTSGARFNGQIDRYHPSLFGATGKLQQDFYRVTLY